jgi:hypothetical protein
MPKLSQVQTKWLNRHRFKRKCQNVTDPGVIDVLSQVQTELSRCHRFRRNSLAVTDPDGTVMLKYPESTMAKLYCLSHMPLDLMAARDLSVITCLGFSCHLTRIYVCVWAH